MGMLQVKNLPDELHRKLAERARSQHVSMSEYVTRLLREDLGRPTIEEWLAEADSSPTRDIDVVTVLDEVRDELETDAGRAHS